MPSLQPDLEKSTPKILSVGGFGSLSERLSKMRHDIRNKLGIVSAAAQIMQMKPDAATATQRLPVIAAQPKIIDGLMMDFSANFEKHASLIDQISLVLSGLLPSSPQHEAAKGILMSQREEVERLEQQLAVARRAALEAAFAPVLDEAQLRRVAQSVADIEIELTVLRARALAGLVPRLNQSQKKQALDKVTV